jgi:hypothetical protein
MQRLLPLFALSVLACVPEFDDDLSTITEPRLLAIQASPAEAEPGDTVTLRALVAAPEAARPDAPSWSLCLARKPLTELGPVNPDCLAVEDDGSGAVLSLGRGDEVSATLPKDGCTLFGPLAPPPEAGEKPSRPVDPDTTGGYYQPLSAALGPALSIGAVRLDCGIAQAATAQILAYNSQYRPNENPQVSALVSQGDELVEPNGGFTVRAGAAVPLTASWDSCPAEPVCGDGICSAYEDRINCADDCGGSEARGCSGAEPYVWYDLETFTIDPRREGIRVAWYASAGSFEDEQTGRDEGDPGLTTSNVWRAPTRSGPATLWLVIRDSRGGVSWETYRVEVE